VKEEAVAATVVELLPNATYRLQLAGTEQVVAHAAARKSLNFVRLRAGDRVMVVLSPHDTTRGRITKLLSKD
jgi:translation initiation factor IF-1